MATRKFEPKRPARKERRVSLDRPEEERRKGLKKEDVRSKNLIKITAKKIHETARPGEKEKERVV